MRDSAPRALAVAYLGTDYCIDTAGSATPIILRIGHACPQVIELAQACGGAAWGVYLTACNPHSRQLRPAANRRRMRALQQELDRLGYQATSGRARDPTGCWPDEASLWVPGLSLKEGHALARRFGQNAFVWCDPQQQVHLVWVAANGRVQTD